MSQNRLPPCANGREAQQPEEPEPAASFRYFVPDGAIVVVLRESPLQLYGRTVQVTSVSCLRGYKDENGWRYTQDFREGDHPMVRLALWKALTWILNERVGPRPPA